MCHEKILVVIHLKGTLRYHSLDAPCSNNHLPFDIAGNGNINHFDSSYRLPAIKLPIYCDETLALFVCDART